MKKAFLIYVMALISATSVAQETTVPAGDTLALANSARKNVASFVRLSDMPDATKFLPEPPKNGSYTFLEDSLMYLEGKALRETLRGDTAKQDARLDLPYFLKRFGEPLGNELSPEQFPNLAYIVAGTLHDVRGSIQKAKIVFARQRPYQHFNEPSLVPEEESPVDFTSYPSGHSVRAWALAMLFTSLDPAHEDDYIRIGRDICQSRVIAGYHYQSDIEAAKIAASVSFARLIAEPQYLSYMQKARQELNAVLAVEEIK